MNDYLFSSLPPGKCDDSPQTALSSIMANVALVVGVVILIPAIEHFYPAIGGHTPTSLDSRQHFKTVLGPRRDLLSPALDGLSTLHLKVKPTKVIATAVTVIKAVPTPVQKFQEQSSLSPILAIVACTILALVGTVLTFQHYRQGDSWSLSSAASSDNGDSLEPYSNDSAPPGDDSSDDESSGSGGHSPPVPVFDLFYDPKLHVDKAVDTGDEQVRDEDGPPPPPPPSFPTPVEDDDAFKNLPSIFKWLSLTLVLSIMSFVFKRFFKGYSKTRIEVSIPTVSERISVNEISGNIVTAFPSATSNPVIKKINPICPNLLPLVESKIKTKISTLLMFPVSEPSTIKKSMIVVLFLLFMSFLFAIPFIVDYFLDRHLQRITNSFPPKATRRRSPDESTVPVPLSTSVSSLPLVSTIPPTVNETVSAPQSTSISSLPLVPTSPPAVDETVSVPLSTSISSLPLVPTFPPAVDETVSVPLSTSVSSLPLVPTVPPAVDETVSAPQSTSVSSLPLVPTIPPAAYGETVSVPQSTSVSSMPLPTFPPAVDETVSVPQSTSISLPLVPTFAPAADSDEVAADGDEEADDLMNNSVQQELSFNNVGDNTLYMYGKASPLAVDLEDIFDTSENGVPFRDVFRALSISSSSDEIPVSNENPEASTSKLPTTEKKCTVNDKNIKVLSEHVPKSNIPVLAKKVQTVSGPSRGYTLPICGAAILRNSTTNRKTFSVESLSRETASYAPPPQVPMNRQSSSTSLPYCDSSPSPTMSTSIHAPSRIRKGLSASIHAPSSPSEEDFIYTSSYPRRPDSSASIHAPKNPPWRDLSTSIHAPRTPPKRSLYASIHAPSQHEPTEPQPIPVVDLSPERRTPHVINPYRGCDVTVLVDGGSFSR